jgi:hypothetical protein
MKYNKSIYRIAICFVLLVLASCTEYTTEKGRYTCKWENGTTVCVDNWLLNPIILESVDAPNSETMKLGRTIQTPSQYKEMCERLKDKDICYEIE